MREQLASGTAVEVARSPGATPVRGVVVAADIMGLRPLFDDLAARLADEHGWAVAVVEPFPGRESLTRDERQAAMAGLEDDLQVGDLVAAADLVGVEPVGLIGFCMGGMYALKAAGTGRFDRCVTFYGMIRVPAQWRGDGQGEPLHALARPGAAPVLAIVGTADDLTPPDDVDALEATGATVARYEGAEHGFVHDPDRPAHRPTDAADAWARAVAFLHQ